MSPTEIIVRWFVNWVCGFLASHGMPGFDADSMVGAVTTDVVAYGVPCLILARGLYATGRDRVLALWRRRHPAALLDAAAAVPGVTRIEATPALAAATESPAVVVPFTAASVPTVQAAP